MTIKELALRIKESNYTCKGIPCIDCLAINGTGYCLMNDRKLRVKAILEEETKDDIIVKQNKELAGKDSIINFLKKELIHKTSFRQVMKRQHRELKQQKKCNCTICRFERKEISVLKYAQELGGLLFAAVKDKCLADVKEGKMQPSTAKMVIDYLEKPYADIKNDEYSILSWHFLRENPKDLPRNEGWVCNQDGLPCWYDITNDQWLDCEGTQVKTTAWCNMPRLK